MSIAACAEIVRQGDPDRFLATMAAAPEAREILFPIYAFNVEVARAPWVTSEPHLAEIRVQWWADVLAEIADGKHPRMHEVAAPLAGVTTPEVAGILTEVVEARRLDCYDEAFESTDALHAYASGSSGALYWAAAKALGVTSEHEMAVRQVGTAAGLANFLRALPELHARGRTPDRNIADKEVAELAGAARNTLRNARKAVPKMAYAVTRASWLADRTLRSAAANPVSIRNGTLHIPEFHRRGSLLWRVLRGAP